MTSDDKVLVALRRILRGADLHAKRLARDTGLTTPQLLVLQAIAALGAVSIGRVAKEVNLTQATVTTIIDGLVKRGLVYRQRSETDKRMVHAMLTEPGKQILKHAPPALQQNFLRQFELLEDWERSMIIATLQRVAQLMDADELDVAPVLDPGALDRSGESD